MTQPRGLNTLFFTELWERFGFYCIQSLLLLYLIQEFNFNDAHAYLVFSAFSALTYATPVIGGLLADKLIGFQRAIILGGILYIVGYVMLAMGNKQHFYLALSCLIWGNGFFKSCVSSLLGCLYKENDPNRDSGFTIFYMGINLGGFFSPIVCAYLAHAYNWGMAFLAAGIGMVVGVATFLIRRSTLEQQGLSPRPDLLKKRIGGLLSVGTLFYLLVLLAVWLTAEVFHFVSYINTGLIIFSVAIVIFIFYQAEKLEKKQRDKLLVLLVLILFAVVFWSFYMQTFLSLTLFMERNIDRHFLSWTIPTAMYQSLSPLFIMLLTPLFAKIWMVLSKHDVKIYAPMKFFFGLFFMSIAFTVLYLACHYLSVNGYIHMSWVFMLYLIITCGELCLSPIGLSVVTQLAPKNLAGFMMGVWFMSFAAAYAVAGKISDMMIVPKVHFSAVQSLAIYNHGFAWFAIYLAVSALVLLALSPLLDRVFVNKA